MEGKIHCPLKGSPCIFQSKGNFSISECTPRENKSSFMLVFRFDLDLIVAGETIHKREYLTTRTCIYDLINKRCRVVVLRTGFVKVSKFRTNTNSPYFLSTGTGLDTHSVKETGYIKPAFNSFSTSAFTAAALRGFTGRNFCRTGLASG